MTVKFLLPLLLGVFALTMPTWAGPLELAGPSSGSSTALTSTEPDAQSLAWQPEFPPIPPTYTFDTLPLLRLDLRRIDWTMGIDFLAQETVVGSKSFDAAGMMLTFTAAHL